MAFNKLGGVYYTETYEINKEDYGGSIPCFIGRTINPNKDYTAEATELAYIEKAKTVLGGTPTDEQILAKVAELKASADTNDKPTETEINNQKANAKTNDIAKHKVNELQIFNNFEQVNRSTLTDGKLDGLGDYTTEKQDNPLLNLIHDFCEETKLMTEEYVACPYFYVIDLGAAENIGDWINSIETSKIKREIDFEVYVGFEEVKDGANTANLEDFILAVNYENTINRQSIGDFRKAFFTQLTINGTTHKYEDNTYYKSNYKTIDNALITIAKNLSGANNTMDKQFHTNESTGTYDSITALSSNTISKSRTYLIEPLWYGKTVGRISITPYDMEPGYYPYNTLSADDVILRKPSEKLSLQLGGVIFNHLEEISTDEYIKISRTQSVSSNLNNHPPDTLFQSRNLCDTLATRLFDIVYPQIKNKETETNITYLQTNVNKIINDAIADGDFIPPYTVGNERKGTFMSVQESSEDAYDLELVGMMQPVNCTYSIHIVAQINDAKIRVTSA